VVDIICVIEISCDGDGPSGWERHRFESSCRGVSVLDQKINFSACAFCELGCNGRAYMKPGPSGLENIALAYPLSICLVMIKIHAVGTLFFPRLVREGSSRNGKVLGGPSALQSGTQCERGGR
jgi:hypothetical protein